MIQPLAVAETFFHNKSEYIMSKIIATERAAFLKKLLVEFELFLMN